jgi:hypothetical protein
MLVIRQFSEERQQRHLPGITSMQVPAQMPPLGTVSQKDHSGVAHQFDALVSARRIDIEFCCN